MPILKLTDICKDYQQGKEPVRVLKNINLTVEKGDYLAIMGPSGSGKTTLMNIIGCLDVPTSGSYILEGRDLKDLSDDDLAEVRNKHIGFVFQSFHLLPKMEAVDNVALPLLYADVPLKERRARAEEALKAVPDSYREASFGLGAGKVRTIFRIVLPAAIPGILAGVILAVGRVVGETAALIYTAGTVADFPKGIFSSGRTLSVHMYELSREGLHTGEAYATSVILIVVVLLINWASNKFAKKLGKNS